MSEPKWTPGPWYCGYLDKHHQRVVSSAFFEIATCWHHCVGSIEKEMEANAHLIAASPTLYGALEELTKRFRVACLSFGADQDFVEEAVAKYDAILAAARGEG